MSAKRHHYLPAFLIRRFAQRKEPLHVYRLDIKTGRTLLVPPRSQGFKHQFYRFEIDGKPVEIDGEPVDPGFVERALQQLESATARVIRRLVAGEEIPLEDRAVLAFFCVLQQRRTPNGRKERRFLDEFMHKALQEVRFSNRDEFCAEARERFPHLSEEEVERFRVETLEDLKSGKLVFEAPPAREIAMMFFQVHKIVPMLLQKCDWQVLRVDEDAPDLVLADVGVTQVDHTPKHPRAGAGWLSSPTSETILPIDPRFALLVTPGSGLWAWGRAEADVVDDINLRSYAVSDLCYFGTSQRSVCDLRRLARSRPYVLADYAPRPARLWITETTEGRGSGEMEFTGYSIDGTTKATFTVDPDATRSSRLANECSYRLEAVPMLAGIPVSHELVSCWTASTNWRRVPCG